MCFCHFSLIARKDLRDIFDQLSVTRKSKITLNSDKSRSAPELFHEKPEKRKIGECTRAYWLRMDGNLLANLTCE